MNDIELAYLQSAAHVRALLNTRGHKPVISPAVLAAALDLHRRPPAEDPLERAIEFFRTRAVIVPSGLRELPAAWLTDLPGLLWSTRKAHWAAIPYMINQVTFEDGVLTLAFAQELPSSEDRLTAWDKLRIHLNLSCYPNLWRPLTPELERSIWDSHPGLRRELFRLPA